MCIAHSADDGNIPSVERNANTNKEKNHAKLSNYQNRSWHSATGRDLHTQRSMQGLHWKDLHQRCPATHEANLQRRTKVRNPDNSTGHTMKCKQCRQPLEEWEAGICEGCGIMKIMIWTGRTARQEILATAALRMKCFGWTATNAILSCVDAWQSKPEGSICHSVGLYVDALTDREFKRLEGDVRRKAKSE